MHQCYRNFIPCVYATTIIIKKRTGYVAVVHAIPNYARTKIGAFVKWLLIASSTSSYYALRSGLRQVVGTKLKFEGCQSAVRSHVSCSLASGRMTWQPCCASSVTGFVAALILPHLLRRFDYITHIFGLTGNDPGTFSLYTSRIAALHLKQHRGPSKTLLYAGV